MNTEKTFWSNIELFVLRSVLCLAGGVLLWLFPNELAKGAVIALGIVLTLAGIISIYFSQKSSKNSTAFYLIISGAILLMAFGVALLVANAFFANFFMTVVGIIVVLLAILQQLELLGLRQNDKKTSLLLFLSPIIMLAVGILVVLHPEKINRFIGYIAAVTLIYNGVADIFLAIKTQKLHKVLEKAEEQNTEVGIAKTVEMLNAEEVEK